MRGHAWDLARQSEQRRIAEEGDDDEKGLLAIYLDLTALANGAAGQLAEAYASAETMRNSREWEAALAAHDQALLVRDAAFDNEADNDKALDVALAAHTEALETLLNVRAPNIAALVEKARRGINEAYTELLDECADDAETIERLLAEPEWESGSIVAALYQDALALSGDRGPIPSIKCPSFIAAAWLDATEAATGARITGAPDGQWALWFTNAASRAAFDGLKRWQREFVISEVMLKRVSASDHPEGSAFDARGFLLEFEAIGGRVISNGQSFAVLYPAETDIIPTALIDWGAVIGEAHDRAIYGA